MNLWLPILIALAALLGAAVVYFLVRGLKGGRGSSGLAEEIGRMTASVKEGQQEMEARLRADQRALTERLHAQEVKLNKTLEDGLLSSTKKTLETMGKLEARLAVIDKAQENITQLSSQVVGLQDILSNKQARGAFGEIQLADLVRQVLPPSAYRFQAQLSNGRQPDCLLDLPNPPGPIVIDAKFPLESYHALRAATDEAAKKVAGRAFRDALRKHINDIAARYILPGETAESALMFLPSEAVYAELHSSFLEVVEESYRARVFIVSPTTLWATLNTVRAILKDVRMREQAGLIQIEVHAMLDDVGRLDDRVGKLQRHFDQATEDMRQIRVSTDKVLKRGERIDDVQLEDGEESDAIPDSGSVEYLAEQPRERRAGDD